YQPMSNDAAGAYSSSRGTNLRYGTAASQYGQSSDTAQAAAAASDPTSAQPPVTEPAIPLGQSPYATAVSSSAGTYGSSSQEAPPTTAPAADSAPPTDAANAYGNRYRQGNPNYAQPVAPPATAPTPSEFAPRPNALLPAEL